MDNTQLIINMYKNGIGIKKISTILGISFLEVNQCLYENKVDYENERDRKICFLYNSGKKITEIANELGINRHTVADVLKVKNDIYINNNHKKERDNKIIELYVNGKSMREVAKAANLSVSTIKNVLDKYKIEKRPMHHKGHSLGTSKNRKHNFDLNYFENIDTEEKAYWLGFLYADGYVSYSGLISLGLSKQDELHLNKLKKCVKADSVNLIYKKETSSCTLNLCSVKMARDLIKLGCTQKKSTTLKFPTEDQVPNHLIHHFMRGYFDGDGCIYIQGNKSNINFSLLGTKSFLDNYEKILLDGINRTKPNKRIHQKHWNENTECISYGGKKQVISIYNFLYKDATVYLKRKYDKFNTLLPS